MNTRQTTATKLETADGKVDFGYRRVSPSDKSKKVRAVFDMVADRYDLMNDLMSLGIHRLWKRVAVDRAGVCPGQTVLDLAGGSGDMTKLMAPRVGANGKIMLADINPNMLTRARERLIDCGIVAGIEYLEADAESLPLPENSIDTVTMAFGLRNVTDKNQALREIARVLKPGGQVLILEFSKPLSRPLSVLYDAYSFTALPLLGKLVAGDVDSYRYLAESIRMHPDQERLADMMRTSGLVDIFYENLSGGIVALHRAVKPYEERHEHA